MTHDELLAKVKDDFFFTEGFGTVLHMNSCYGSPCHCNDIDITHLKLKNAMIAVVELHYPINGLCNLCIGGNCSCCTGFESEVYPCPTIQAIEKELI